MIFESRERIADGLHPSTVFAYAYFSAFIYNIGLIRIRLVGHKAGQI
jgi:hypothetical protein